MVSPEQLESIIAAQLCKTPPQRNTPADIESSLHDFLRMSAGQTIREPEPLARSWIRGGMDLPGIRAELGLTTSDFSAVMSGATTAIMRASFNSASGDILGMTKPLDVDDWKPARSALMDISEPQESVDGGPLAVGEVKITETPIGGGLREFGQQLHFSRPVMLSHGAAIVESIAAHAVSFSVIETRLVAELLESATLDTSASSPLGVAGMAAVANMLRTQENAAGARLNLPLAIALVPPELETSALVLVESLGRAGVRVIVNCYLSSPTTWFGLTNPALAAPVRRMRLRGGGQPTIVMDGRRSMENGAKFALNHVVGFRLAGGKTGIIKATA